MEMVSYDRWQSIVVAAAFSASMFTCSACGEKGALKPTDNDARPATLIHRVSTNGTSQWHEADDAEFKLLQSFMKRVTAMRSETDLNRKNAILQTIRIDFLRTGDDVASRLQGAFTGSALRNTMSDGERQTIEFLLNHECFDLFQGAEDVANHHLALLSHPDPEVRWLAARSASYYDDNVLAATAFGLKIKQYELPGRIAAIVDELFNSLDDDAPNVRLASLNSLAWLADEGIVSVPRFYAQIEHLRDDPSMIVRSRLAEMVKESPEPSMSGNE